MLLRLKRGKQLFHFYKKEVNTFALFFFEDAEAPAGTRREPQRPLALGDSIGIEFPLLKYRRVTLQERRTYYFVTPRFASSLHHFPAQTENPLYPNCVPKDSLQAGSPQVDLSFAIFSSSCTTHARVSMCSCTCTPICSYTYKGSVIHGVIRPRIKCLQCRSSFTSTHFSPLNVGQRISRD